MPIRWVRTASHAASAVRDGACVLHLPVTSSRLHADRIAAEPLVRQCLASGGLRAGAGDFDLHWYEVASSVDVEARADNINPRPHAGVSVSSAMAVASLHRPPAMKPYLKGGVFKRAGQDCIVVTKQGWPVLAHELRHCYDGKWHL